MTECIQSSFGFEACGPLQIVARFDGGTIGSDVGALLVRQTDQQLNLLPRLAECFLDGRNPDQVAGLSPAVDQRLFTAHEKSGLESLRIARRRRFWP